MSLNFNEWISIPEQTIIEQSHFDQIQDNLKWLSEIGIENNEDVPLGDRGRCIADYSTVYATDNITINAPHYGENKPGCGTVYNGHCSTNDSSNNALQTESGPKWSSNDKCTPQNW